MPITPVWKERWVVSYIFDYVIIILLIIGFSALDLAEPFKQRFSLTNESLQYPYADPERIPALWAGVIACLFPLLCLIAWTMLVDGTFSHRKPPTNRRRILGGPWTMGDRLWEMNCAILGLGLSIAGAICITGALKNATGKPRPDVIARCMPPANAINPKVFGLFNPANCTQKDPHILKDGFKSWPSGHASTAFAGLGYLSLFLAGKLHIMDNRGEVWKTFLVLIPLLAAALVAVSRIMDARHHPFDVITGSMLGQATAWVAYRQYFPPISKPRKKGRAYPRRMWGTGAHEQSTATEYAYNLRGLEEGASSESVDSEGKGTRRREVLKTNTDTHRSGQEFELLPQQQRSVTFPPDHPRTGWAEYRESVDMGEPGRREPGLGSPESVVRPLRVGMLSPPPPQEAEERV